VVLTWAADSKLGRRVLLPRPPLLLLLLLQGPQEVLGLARWMELHK
jgi:hypothetical protein